MSARKTKSKRTVQSDVNTPKVARSFLKEDNEQIFKWAIRSDKIDCEHSDFGFHDEIQKKFIEKIAPCLKAYSSMRWADIRQRSHCHDFDVVQLEKEFQERIIEKFGENAPETLFQISLTGKHRIFGYVENGVFYILFNDPEHKGYKVAKKHT